MSVFAVLGESLGYRKCFKASFGFLFKEVSIVLNSKSKFTQLATECLSTKTWLFSENESHSVVSDSFASPWTVACQTPLFMEFSRQKYWSGLPCPSPGDLPNLGIEPGSPALQADSLSTEPPGNADLQGLGGGHSWLFTNSRWRKKVLSLEVSTVFLWAH